jgi:hypothetical protein
MHLGTKHWSKVHGILQSSITLSTNFTVHKTNKLDPIFQVLRKALLHSLRGPPISPNVKKPASKG